VGFYEKERQRKRVAISPSISSVSMQLDRGTNILELSSMKLIISSFVSILEPSMQIPAVYELSAVPFIFSAF
jgi:hypothetical protein